MGFCALMGAAVAVGPTFGVPDEYESVSKMRVIFTDENRAYRIAAAVLTPLSLARMIEAEGLYLDERRRLPIGDVVERLLSHDLNLNLFLDSKKSQNLWVYARSRDPRQAQQVAESVNRRIFDVSEDMRRQSTALTFRVELLERASLPKQPKRRARWNSALWGATAGVLMAGAYLFLRRFTAEGLHALRAMRGGGY